MTNLRFDMLDFPTAWAIQQRGGLPHRLGCSSDPHSDPIAGPHFLCDCGAVIAEWERLRGAAAVKAGNGNAEPK